MRKLSIAILGAAAWLSLTPAAAHNDLCARCTTSCEACCHHHRDGPWHHDPYVSRDQAYHEIFGDGPGHSGKRRNKGKSKNGKAAGKAGAAASAGAAPAAAPAGAEAPAAPAPEAPTK
jgi:hypothetical protein